MVLGELDSNMQKNEIRPLSYTIQKKKKPTSKWIKDLNVRQETIKTLEEKAGKDLSDLSHSNWHIPKGKGIKSKTVQLGPHQDKKLLHCKGNNQQN